MAADMSWLYDMPAGWLRDAQAKADAAPTPNLDYNTSQYGQDYEPSRDTALSYNDRMRLQMYKDEAIRDSKMTMSMDEALELMGGDSLAGQDLSGQKYQDAYEVITDAYENPGKLSDMTDDQIIQLKRVGSSQLGGNLYTAALSEGGAGAAGYFDTDFQDVVNRAGQEGIDRYGSGKFAEEYAGSPDAVEAPRIGAGGIADAIRGGGGEDLVTRSGDVSGAQDDIDTGGAYVPTKDPSGGYYYGRQDSLGDNQFGSGGGVQGVGGGYGPGFQRQQTSGAMSNQQLYDTQFSNLVGQQNNFQNQQNMASAIREENAAKPPVGAPQDPWSWYNEGKGLPDRRTSEEKSADPAFREALGKKMAVPGSAANAALGDTLAGLPSAGAPPTAGTQLTPAQQAAIAAQIGNINIGI